MALVVAAWGCGSVPVAPPTVEGSITFDGSTMLLCQAAESGIPDCSGSTKVEGLSPAEVPQQWPDGQGGWYTLDPVKVRGRRTAGVLRVAELVPMYRLDAVLNGERVSLGHHVVAPGQPLVASLRTDWPGAPIAARSPTGGELIVEELPPCPPGAGCVAEEFPVNTDRLQEGEYVFEAADGQRLVVTAAPAPAGLCPEDIVKNGTC